MTTPYENIYPKSTSCSLFSKCCLCIPLKTGCFILGYISLVINFIIILFFIGTLSFLASYTHGFRHFHLKIDDDGALIPDEDFSNQSALLVSLAILILVGLLNIAWFLLNIVLLIGLHRKRPGHIKLHVSVATIRLVLSIVGVVVYGPRHTRHSMYVASAEIALSTYFIFLYYMYAVQLEQEQRPIEPREVSDIIADVLSNYPQNIDKIILTEKNDMAFSA